jgi:hypothetical protein
MQEFVGKVTQKPFAVGSKSEHQAIVLETDKGEFVLRRQGGNPFHDLELEKLIGKRIRCRGQTADYTLIISDWDENPERSSGF